MSICNCTGKCKIPPYTCSGLSESGTLTVSSSDIELTLSLCIHGIPVKFGNCDQCRIETHNYGFNELKKDLQELRDFIFGHHPYSKNLANRVQDIEEEIIILKQENLDLESLVREIGKSPHICPLCNNGRIWLQTCEELSQYCKTRKRDSDYGMDWYIDCNACQGKGILWESGKQMKLKT